MTSIRLRRIAHASVAISATLASIVQFGAPAIGCDNCGGQYLTLRSAMAVTAGAWSNPATWGGTVPATGAHVHIPSTLAVTLDVDPAPLGSIMVEGTLRVAARNTQVRAGWILVTGSSGRLEIGTESTPFANTFDLTLDGQVTVLDGNGQVRTVSNPTGIGNQVRVQPVEYHVMDMGMGGRFLGAADGGTIDIHGSSASKRSWTSLSGDVAAGATTITLADAATGWQIGDRIVIAPSGYDPYEAEDVTITAISGAQVTVTPALRFPHFGRQQTYNGRTWDTRAEVGLLSRNIRIRGANDAAATTYKLGGHCMFMQNTTVRIRGVELERMGQSGRQGRYPLHWHLAGDGSGEYVRDNSIHRSLHRGIVIHGTNHATAQRNTLYDINLHSIVIEDGNEENNLIEENLVVKTNSVPATEFAFTTAREGVIQSEWQPASYWISNANNRLINNRAAGGYLGMGFFYDTARVARPHESSTAAPYAPEFRGNIAHSYFSYTGGFERYPQTTVGHGLLLIPTGTPGWPRTTEFRDYLGYKNSVSGVWMETREQVIRDSGMLDNPIGVNAFGGTMHNLTIIGQTANRRGANMRIGGFEAPTFVGIAGDDHGGDGAVWDIDQVHIASATTGALAIFELHPGDTVMRRVTVADQSQRFHFRRTTAGSFLDQDGSASGTGVRTIVADRILGDGANSTPYFDRFRDHTPMYLNRMPVPSQGYELTAVFGHPMAGQGSGVMLTIDHNVMAAGAAGSGTGSFTGLIPGVPYMTQFRFPWSMRLEFPVNR